MAHGIFPDQEWLLLPAMSSAIPDSGVSNKWHVGIQSVPIHLNCVCWFKGEERDSKGRCSVFLPTLFEEENFSMFYSQQKPLFWHQCLE